VINQNYVSDVRQVFRLLYEAYLDGKPVEVSGTLEIVGASFIADEPTIFGAVDEGYVQRELEWYNSRSLNVEDIPGETPKIWRQVADKDGHINSNYGYLMWSEENYDQIHSVVAQLKMQPEGRRAVAVYTRPSIHVEWQKNGMSDFICTNSVNYYQRGGKLHAVVQMRSNDAVFGFRNDLAWQKYLLDYVAGEIGVEPGLITWQPGSIHIYARHYHLLDHFILTGEFNKSVKKDPAAEVHSE
jgi:thymidylate synthase